MYLVDKLPSVAEARRILTPEHQRMISDETDLRILAKMALMKSFDIVENASVSDQRFMEYMTDPECFKIYLTEEDKWTFTARHFLVQRLGREPSIDEFLEEIDRQRISERFRVFFYLKNFAAGSQASVAA